MLDIAKHKIDHDCPKCGTTYTVTLLQVSKEEVITCSGCGVEIQLKDDGSVAKSIKDVNKSLGDLQRTLDRLGRKR